MIINKYWPWEISGKIDELAVVADIYAATTNITNFLSKKPNKLFLVNKDSAVTIKAKDPEAIIIGESHDLPNNFFYAPNPPYKQMHLNIGGKVVYYMSTNGTKKIELAFQKGAKEIIALSFLNINSLSKWIISRNIQSVTLIASGESSYQNPKCPEDIEAILCLEKLLKGERVDWQEAFKKLLPEWREYYKTEDKHQIAEDQKLIFQVDLNPIIPVCKLVSTGKILVSSL